MEKIGGNEMLIRSQDKTMLINLENIANIHINGERIGVVYFQGECADTIAEYSTKEKAIKALDMIQDVYTQYGTIKDGLGNVHGAFNIPKCFQMPQDNEVEV